MQTTSDEQRCTPGDEADTIDSGVGERGVEMALRTTA